MINERRAAVCSPWGKSSACSSRGAVTNVAIADKLTESLALACCSAPREPPQPDNKSVLSIKPINDWLQIRDSDFEADWRGNADYTSPLSDLITLCLCVVKLGCSAVITGSQEQRPWLIKTQDTDPIPPLAAELRPRGWATGRAHFCMPKPALHRVAFDMLCFTSNSVFTSQSVAKAGDSHAHTVHFVLQAKTWEARRLLLSGLDVDNCQ